MRCAHLKMSLFALISSTQFCSQLYTKSISGADGKIYKIVDAEEATRRTDYRMIVKNLSSKVSCQDLKDVMRRTGEVTYADAHNDRRNEGVVEFVNKCDLEQALDKYNGYEWHGQKLEVFKDKNRSRSRSRSPLRSNNQGKNKCILHTAAKVEQRRFN